MHHDAPDPAVHAKRMETVPNDPTPQDVRLRAYLSSLPEPAPPATLWPRIQVTQARRRRQRRRWAALASAAALVLAVLPLRLLRDEAVVPPAAPVAAERVAPSRIDSTRIDAETLAQIRALDRELQAGYARGADEAELASLWRARRAALTGTRRLGQTQPLRI